MDWTRAASIAEVISAVGVIISLLYLAAQVKHNTVQARNAGAHEINATTNSLLMLLASDRGVAETWTKGLTDFDSLDVVDRVRFSSLMLNLTYGWDEAHHAFDLALLDKWGLERTIQSMPELALTPGFRAWYKIRRDWMSDEIRVRLDELMRHDAPDSPFYRHAKAAGEAGVT